MRKDETTLQDELRPEYDLRTLQVRKVGRGRKSFGRSVQLAPDVIERDSATDCERQCENEQRIHSAKI